MTEEQIQPQSAVDSQPKFQKPRKQKVRKDPNAPFIREKLELPEGHNKLLLHSCCAPCSGEVMEAILASGIEFTIYFNSPKIDFPIVPSGISTSKLSVIVAPITANVSESCNFP